MIRTNAYTFEKDLPIKDFQANKVTKSVFLRDGELKEKDFAKSLFVSIEVDKATCAELDKIFSNRAKNEEHEPSYKDNVNNEINCVKIGEKKFYFTRSSCNINYLNNKAHIVVKEKEDTV